MFPDDDDDDDAVVVLLFDWLALAHVASLSLGRATSRWKYVWLDSRGISVTCRTPVEAEDHRRPRKRTFPQENALNLCTRKIVWLGTPATRLQRKQGKKESRKNILQWKINSTSTGIARGYSTRQARSNRNIGEETGRETARAKTAGELFRLRSAKRYLAPAFLRFSAWRETRHFFRGDDSTRARPNYTVVGRNAARRDLSLDTETAKSSAIIRSCRPAIIEPGRPFAGHSALSKSCGRIKWPFLRELRGNSE